MIRPYLRIKLVSPYQDPRLMLLGINHRPDGPDNWEVKMTYVSSEGAMDIQRFRSMHKEKALYKAYEYIKSKREAEVAMQVAMQKEVGPPPVVEQPYVHYTPEMDLLPEEFYSPSKRWWQFWR